MIPCPRAEETPYQPKRRFLPMILTDNVESSSPKRNIGDQVGMNQTEETTTDTIQNLRRQEIGLARILEPNDESTAKGQTENGSHEERFASHSQAGQGIAHIGRHCHGQLCRDNGSRGERNRRSILMAVVILTTHEFPQDEQDVGIGKAVDINKRV